MVEKDKNAPKKIELIETKKLIPYARNSRTHSDVQIKQIAASIREFGFTNAVLIDQDNGVIAGHGRILAAELIDMKKVPCVRLSHLTETQKRAYIIADNKLALNAGWDDETLALELQEIIDAGFDAELIGFSEDELDELLQTVEEGLTDEDAVPDVPDDPVAQLGDIYILGDHRLMCGDSTDKETVAKLMDGAKADMVFTDPPYGISIVGGNGKIGADKPFGSKKGNIGNMRGELVECGQYKEIIGDDTIDAALLSYQICEDLKIKKIIMWGGQYYAHAMPPAKCWIVWDKETDGTLGDGELAWTNIDRAVQIFRHKWSGMIKASEHGQKRVHPTQKPIALAEWAFDEFKAKNNILDLFGGSGSTLIACEKTSRNCYMMELDPHYCDVIIKRWEDFTGKKAVKHA